MALGVEDQDSVDIGEDNDEVEPPAKKFNTKEKGERKVKSRSSIASSFKEYMAEKKEEGEKVMDTMIKLQKERKDTMSSFLEVFKKMADK